MAKPQTIRLRAADGVELGARVFSPDGSGAKARGGVVINCGTGLTQRLYKHLARFLAGQGYEAMTYDYRGMGESRPEDFAGMECDKTQWARLDFAAALAWHRERAPDRPLFVIGHSFGGQAVGFLPESRELAGIVLVAAQSGDLRHWHGEDRDRLEWAFRYTIPVQVERLGYLPGGYGTGDDLPGGVALEWRKWCLSDGFFTGPYPETLDNFAAIRCPVLSVSFADDLFYAPREAIAELLGWMSNAEIERRETTPEELDEEEIGHFGFFTRVVGESLWPDVVAFLDRVVD